jgi:hypothetical protein
MRGDTVKTRVIAVGSGALVTLFLWVFAFVVLNGIYQGDFPWLLLGWLLIGLAAVLGPLAGGYVTARLSRTRSFRLGALSGFSAGLVVLLVSALASHLASNTTLAGVGLMVAGALGGGIGTLLSPLQRAGKQKESTE